MSQSVTRIDLGDERAVRAAWSRITEPIDEEASALIRELGPGPALRGVLAGQGPSRWRARLPEADPLGDLAALHRAGGRLLIPGDEDWPAQLGDLAEREPICLWMIGEPPPSGWAAPTVSIVGARAATAYGEQVAAELAAGCAERGVSVISGAAYGIDGAAHRGALAVRGYTAAVLAGGAERDYPRGHAGLLSEIRKAGAVVSELPPGSAPTRSRFLTRNRLIAALGLVTVVVEAGWRSGARSTAHHAVNLGRSVAAVPGPVTSPASAGCHQLLRDGSVCVTDVAEVLELLAPFGQDLAPDPPIAAAAHDGLGPIDLRVFDALPVRRSADVTSLSRVAGLSQREVLAALGRLEASGRVQRVGAGWCRGDPGGSPRRHARDTGVG